MAADLTEEQRQLERERQTRLRERERVEALRRRQMEEQSRMRREMRRRASLTQGDADRDSAPLPELDPMPQSIKRRTSLAPRQLSGPQVPSYLSRSHSSAPRPAPGQVPVSSQYKGELTRAEVDEGYGLGMATSLSRRVSPHP